jgi:hypothetical protein
VSRPARIDFAEVQRRQSQLAGRRLSISEAMRLHRMRQVHAASLPRQVAALVHGLDKQETPGVSAPRASTDHEPSAEVPGGCSRHSTR